MVLPTGNIKEKKFKLMDGNVSKQHILFLFNSMDEKPIEKFNIMNMLFFISLNIPSLDFEFNFEADGLCCELIEINLEYLCMEGFLIEDAYGYRLDKLGVKYLTSRTFDDIDFKLIGDMKDLFDGLTFDEAFALTYFTVPEITSKSFILDRIMDNRMELAFSLYKKHKISMGKASEIAGISMLEFNKLLSKYNIKFGLEIQ